MNDSQARALLENLLDRLSTDTRLAELVTPREAAALRLLLQDDDTEPPTPTTPAGQQMAVDSPAFRHSPAYEGAVHLCLDFGTAMSKAFAWDRERDEPMMLEIGNVAGETGSPFVLQSTLFVAHDGTVHFGESAFNAAAAADPQLHRPFRSIKDLLTVGQPEALSQPLAQEYNPTQVPITNRETIVLYFAFLTDVALVALERHGEPNSRRIPRSYTKPVFDEERDNWATEVLTECASVGQLLADEFSGRWANGIRIEDIRSALNRLAPLGSELRHELILEAGILPEPVAAFASRCWHYEPAESTRRIFMVVDVGAGTTDFAMFAEVDDGGQLTIAPIAGSVTTVRFAGDMIDNLLLRHLLDLGGIIDKHPQYGHLVADLQREIRLIKEDLFEQGSIRRLLVNDIEVETDLSTFQSTEGMEKLGQAMRNKFLDVLDNVDPSWLTLGNLPVFFTGGGAALPLVTQLADGRAIRIGPNMLTPRAARSRPAWLEDEYYAADAITPFYEQLAVCIGGACSGAGCTPHVELQRSLLSFGGDIPKAEWEVDVVRKGR